MQINVQLADAVQRLCDAFADGLRAVLGSKLHSLYVYGAAVFPETKGTGDVDLHAIIESELTPAERERILALHRQMSERFPPLGAELDAYVILLREAQRSGSPVHQLDTTIVDDSWALHRAHLLAGRCVVLHGPEPSEILAEPTWMEIDEALQGELSYVERHLEPYPDYCILNLCRLMYSYQTRDVVISKFAAAAWAVVQYPEWRELVGCAQRSYTGDSTPGDREMMRSAVPDLLRFAHQEIDTSRLGSVDGATG